MTTESLSGNSMQTLAEERRPRKSAKENPVLSVVVIGRNEGARLVRCLESINQMRPVGGPIEIIYVDSGSTDGSVEQAAQFEVKIKRLESASPCAASGRNAGWRAASAPIIFFLDGDTVLAPGFVSDAIAELDDPKIAVVFGNRREIDPNASIYTRVLDREWIAPAGAVEFCGGDALIRREVLERVGGFDERLIAGEEPEMCRRIRALGLTILHIDRPMTGHDLAITRFSQYWRRALRTGYAYAEVSSKFKNTDLPLWQREARGNLIRGASMLGIVLIAPLASIAMHSIIPIVALLAVVAALALRTAIRFRWDNADLITLLLFGLHSHLVHIPLLFGQLKYQRDRLKGNTTKLIEYKDATAAISTEEQLRTAKVSLSRKS